MKRGTAEQEQKGVTIPSMAASTFPTDSRFPARILRVRSGSEIGANDSHPEDHQNQKHEHFGRVVKEKLYRASEMFSVPDRQIVDGQELQK